MSLLRLSKIFAIRLDIYSHIYYYYKHKTKPLKQKEREMGDRAKINFATVNNFNNNITNINYYMHWGGVL